MKIFFKIAVFTTLCFALNVSHANPANGALKILVTGFEPFGGYKSNPTSELVEYINNLPDNKINNIKLKAITLPVTYYKSWEKLKDEITHFRPEYIVSFGYAPDSHGVRIESTAKNHDRGYQDNEDTKHLGEIIANAPSFYSSELPVLDIENQLIKRDIPVTISSDAGGYICNHIFYLERDFTSRNKNTKSGFFHVPDWPVSGKKGLWMVTEAIISAIVKNHNPALKLNSN